MVATGAELGAVTAFEPPTGALGLVVAFGEALGAVVAGPAFVVGLDVVTGATLAIEAEPAVTPAAVSRAAVVGAMD